MGYTLPLRNRPGGYAGLNADGRLALPTAGDMQPGVTWTWAAGSLAQYTQWDALNRIGATVATTAVPIEPWAANARKAFTALNVGGGTATVNPTFFLNYSSYAASEKIDLSAFSVTNDNMGGSGTSSRRAGVLISDQHVLFSYHFRPPTAKTFYFANSAGTLVGRTLSALVQAGSTDLCVGYLSSAVPSGFTWARVLPTDWRRYLPSPWFTAYRQNQNNEYSIVECAYCGPHEAIFAEFQNLDTAFGRPPTTPYQNDGGGDPAYAYTWNTSYLISRPPTLCPSLARWNNHVLMYDSSQPLFILLDDRPVLLGTTISGDCVFSGSANALYLMNDLVNAAMTTAGGTQQLTEVSAGELAAFTEYPTE